MPSEEPADTGSRISGGIFYGPVLQGRDIQATFQLPTAAPVALAQLPAVTAGFTGRSGELVLLAGLLDPAGAAGPVVVSAVAGLAGVGKTALAVQAGHAAMERGWFGGGVLFIDLHGYDDRSVLASQALDALLRALGVPAEHIPPNEEDRAGLYRSVLAQIGEPVLVIADNASTEAQVKPLLPGIGPHKVLVTSRNTLAGLGARLVDVTVLGEQAAIELLHAALRAARPDDERISSDPPGAARLAGLCAGLPLALQITAALLKADPALNVAELADELSSDQDRMAALHYDDGSGAAEPSVVAAFGLSYRRLDDKVARVFRLLPVNPGPDVSTAVAAVLADLSTTDARRVLADLARAHLVEAAAGRPGRWRMHDLVRLYAQQLSDAHANIDSRDRAADRLLEYYLNSAGDADQCLRLLSRSTVPMKFTSRDAALEWLDVERVSLVAAVRMAADTGRDHVALNLPLALAGFLAWRRYFEDLRAASTISLEAARHLGDRHRQGRALGNLGLALQGARRFDEAIIASREAAAIYRETDDRHREGMVLNNLAQALTELGRFEEAIVTCREAAAIYQETGDRRGEGDAWNNLGNVLETVRRFGEAITAFQDAMAIYNEIGDRHREAMALDNLGNALHEAEQFEDAIRTHRDAVTIFEDTGDKYSAGIALSNLGETLRKVNRFEEAIAAYRHIIAIYRETGHHSREGTALNNLGVTLRQVGRFEEAIAAHRDAAALYEEIGDEDGEIRALDGLEAARAAQQT